MQSKTYKIICFDFSANDNSDGALNKFDTDISVHFNGKNKWLAPVIFKSTCKINVAFFPFDEQVLIGPLQDPVTWYGINYTETQMTQWDFQNKGTLTSPARLSFVFKVRLRH